MAALDLFERDGFEATTAAGIARQVGVTERTFFRHFPDKREVLFDGEQVLREALTGYIAGAPVGLRAFDLLFGAFQSVVPLLEANRAFSVPRLWVIEATPALKERELAKEFALARWLADALMGRGIDAWQANAAAQIAMISFAEETTAWLKDPSQGLGPRLTMLRKRLTTLLKQL